VKYTDDLVLLATEGTLLEGMIDGLIENGRGYGLRMNVEKTKVLRISKATVRSTDYDRSETTGEYGMFKLFDYYDYYLYNYD
jgi:hypothetical protein